MANPHNTASKPNIRSTLSKSQDWLARANQALDAGNEDLAKKALAKKAESDQQLASMKTGIDAARNASESLKQHVNDLKRRIDEAEPCTC